LPVVAALLLFLACPALVHAHAVVIESSPRDGARLSRPPGEIVLRFNARIEKSLTRLNLATADGRNVPLLPPSPERGDMGGDDRLVILLPPLGPGTYLLRYKILSTDGHATPGILRFTVTGGP
jgi:methionine-rich copper-binding protein CopC